MGTRSLTFVYNDADAIVPLVNMYRQFDGYPSGHGLELAEFLENRIVVNGYSEKSDKISNGMGCLAASMISHFKQTTGEFYIIPVSDKNCGQDYEYHVFPDKVVVFSYGDLRNVDIIFSGTWEEFKSFCGYEE